MKRFLGILAIWTVLALLFSTQIVFDAMYAGHPVSWPQALILAFAGWYGWALLSPLVIALARRLRFDWRGWTIHAIASLLLTFLKLALTTELLRRSGMPPRNVSLVMNLPVSIATYWVIVGATRAIDTHLRASRLAKSLAEARLELLRSQLHPHFLFNTLHGISELMHEDVDAADRMLTQLSDLLRASLDASGRDEVPLRDELAMVERYLDIERVRLGDRLRVRIDADPDTLTTSVPNFILQPIVENSVRHAVARRASGGTITIRAARDADRVNVDVSDDGPGFGDATREGIGLANVRERMEHLYGSGDLVSIGGTTVRLRVPWRSA